jgi:hypothetical protein
LTGELDLRLVGLVAISLWEIDKHSPQRFHSNSLQKLSITSVSSFIDAVK